MTRSVVPSAIRIVGAARKTPAAVWQELPAAAPLVEAARKVAEMATAEPDVLVRLATLGWDLQQITAWLDRARVARAALGQQLLDLGRVRNRGALAERLRYPRGRISKMLDSVPADYGAAPAGRVDQLVDAVLAVLDEAAGLPAAATAVQPLFMAAAAEAAESQERYSATDLAWIARRTRDWWYENVAAGSSSQTGAPRLVLYGASEAELRRALRIRTARDTGVITTT